MKQKSPVYFYTCCALMAALLCIAGPNAIPIGPVPITLTNLMLYFIINILETKGTLYAYLLYLLLGACSLPVFSGYSGGFDKLAGPTGGYLIGFIPMILIMGICMKKGKGNVFISFAGMVIGTAVAYTFGTIWFVIITGSSILAALTTCVFPFVLFDVLKMVVGLMVGTAVRIPLKKAGLLDFLQTSSDMRNSGKE